MVVAQAIGWIAMLSALIRFQMKTARQIRFMNIITAGIFGFHYLLLGGLSGAILCWIGSARSSLLMSKALWRYKLYIVIASLVLCSVVSFFIYESWIDLLPLFGLYFGTLMDAQHKAMRMRGFAVMSQCCWLIYNILVGSHGGMVSASLSVSSNIIGFWRHQLWPYLKTRDKRYFDI